MTCDWRTRPAQQFQQRGITNLSHKTTTSRQKEIQRRIRPLLRHCSRSTSSTPSSSPSSPEPTTAPTIPAVHRRRTAPRPAGRPVATLLLRLHRNPHLASLATDIEPDTALAALSLGQAGDDCPLGRVEVDKLQECTGLGTHDFEILDGPEALRQVVAEGCLRNRFCDALRKNKLVLWM